MRHAKDGRGNYNEGTMYDQREREVHFPTKKKQNSTGCTACIKYLLFAFNFVFFIIAGLITAGGIYILIEKTFISYMFNNNLLTVATWIIIMAGGVTILISICGCFGAWTENGKLLIVYGAFIATLFLALLAAAVTALVLRSQLGEWVRASMEETLKEDYGIDLDDEYHQQITYAWDKGQQSMQCCSVQDQSWFIYRQSKWYAEQPGIVGEDKAYVPASCCYNMNDPEPLAHCQYNNQGPPGSDNGPQNDALHYRGCYTAGVDWIYRYTGFIMGFGFGAAAFLVCGITFAFCLYTRKRKDK